MNFMQKISIVIFINGIPKYYFNEKITVINDNTEKYYSSDYINISLDYNIEYKYPSIIEVVYIK